MGEFLPMVPKTREELTVPWFNSILTIHDIKVSGVTFLGDAKWNGRGALSSLERIELDIGNGKTLRLILKTLPEKIEVRKYVVDAGFVKREVNMYLKVFKNLDKFLDDRNVPQELRFRRPFCYYGAEKGSGESYEMILVLEDMLDSGYENWESGQSQSLDLDRIKATIREIALFHAGFIGYGMANNVKRYSDVYPFLLDMTKDDPNLEGYIVSGFGFVREMFKNSSHLPPPGLTEQLQNLSILLPTMIKYTFGRDFGFPCIRHHDLHTGNIFYKKTGDNAIKAALIDFQACVNDTPINDVCFFLFCCCDLNESWDNVEPLLKYYHSVFKMAMEAMDVDFTLQFQQFVEDYWASIRITLMHLTTGSAWWCGGPEGNDVSRNRLMNAIVRAYNQKLLDYSPPNL